MEVPSAQVRAASLANLSIWTCWAKASSLFPTKGPTTSQKKYWHKWVRLYETDSSMKGNVSSHHRSSTWKWLTSATTENLHTQPTQASSSSEREKKTHLHTHTCKGGYCVFATTGGPLINMLLTSQSTLGGACGQFFFHILHPGGDDCQSGQSLAEQVISKYTHARMHVHTYTQHTTAFWLEPSSTSWPPRSVWRR